MTARTLTRPVCVRYRTDGPRPREVTTRDGDTAEVDGDRMTIRRQRGSSLYVDLLRADDVLGLAQPTEADHLKYAEHAPLASVAWDELA